MSKRRDDKCRHYGQAPAQDLDSKSWTAKLGQQDFGQQELDSRIDAATRQQGRADGSNPLGKSATGNRNVCVLRSK
jgi:hypothetical protein